jgi:hypothetical protein
MNASFLLPLAAYRRELLHNAHLVGSSVQSSAPQPLPGPAPVEQDDPSVRIETSETCVVPIGALMGACRQQKTPHTESPLQPSVLDGPAAMDMLARPPTASMALDNCCPVGGLQESSSSSETLYPSKECRICLSAGDRENLVRPCSCCGTLSYTHTACLSAWVQERGSLVCELCGQHYKEPHAQQLEPLVIAAMQRRKLAAFPVADVEGSSSNRRRMTRDEWICLL